LSNPFVGDYMAELVVEYVSSSRLSCSGCTPADVVLCVPSALVAPLVCPDAISNAPYAFRHIEAKLISVIRLTNRSCGTFFKYIFSYNSDSLVTGQELTCDDISGVFCKGCMTSWVEDLVGNEVTVSELNNVITFTSQHGCETVIDLSSTETPNTALDSLSIDVSANGVLGRQISAAVIVSPTAGNTLTVLADGVYVPGETANSSADTASINMNASGVLNRIISADLIVSPASGGINNVLTVLPGGAYVPELQITTNANCLQGGLGAGWMVREANHLGGNLLRIGGAPEHTEVTVQTGNAYVAAVDISAIGLYNSASSVTPTLVVNNTSTCRQLVGKVLIHDTLDVTAFPSKNLTTINQISVDGGAFATYNVNQMEYGTTYTLTASATEYFNVSIAPGAFQTFQVRHQVSANSNQVATWLGGTTLLHFIGGTV